MSAQTSDNLISQALARLGNTTLTTLAQTWIYNILDRLYEDFRWPFLEKLTTSSISEGDTGIALPSDFDELWDTNSIVLIDSSSNYFYLKPMYQFDYDLLSAPNTEASPPQYALIDMKAQTWTPYPVPGDSYTAQIRYKYKPTRADSYTTFTPAFPNDAIIEQAIFVTGLQYEDDERYTTELQVLQGMISRYKGKFNRMPQKNKAVRLSSAFKQIANLR
jgi:hypothetical protein